jgi:hypothetical protein
MIYKYGESRWNDADRGKLKKSEKLCSISTWSTTNPTWNDPGANKALGGERQAINLPSHGTALYGGTNTSSLKIYFIFY